MCILLVYLNITNFLNNHPNYTPSKTTEEIRQEIFKLVI